ncbi:MAG: luciferase family protein [Actinomycetota bacterium]
MVVAAACSSVSLPQGDGPTGDELVLDAGEAIELAPRDGPRRETSGDVPHVQLDAAPVPELDEELRRRIFSLPGIEDRPSDRSLPGARGLAFVDQSTLARAEVIAGSSEFAHVHPDGSLHVWTSVASAAEIDGAGWGELHPWAERDGFWPGVVMVFTPETAAEVEVVLAVVVDAYNFVTGADLTPADIP